MIHDSSFFAPRHAAGGRSRHDPDIDLFLAMGANDSASLKAAIDRGGKVNVTTGELLARYEAQLKSVA